jgi:hypothetical protein
MTKYNLTESDTLLKLQEAEEIRIKIVRKLEQALKSRDEDVLRRVVLEVLGELR